MSLSLRNILRNGLPEPSEVEGRSVADQFFDSPLLAPFRLFWESLETFRPYWPVLIPLLMLSAIGSYRKERRRMARHAAKLATRHHS